MTNILGINHITLAVKNLETSINFYTEHLGFHCHTQWAQGAHLEAGDFWLCLTQEEGHQAAQGYTHIALSVNEASMAHFETSLQNIARWQENSSEGPSLYILDPDGHKLELHIGNLYSRLDYLKNRPHPPNK
ncbi:MAG: fosfomycin resistance glutathione transferase [Opitutales bacterium]